MSSEQTLNPNGGVCNRRGVEELSSNSQLLERILAPENVQKERVRRRVAHFHRCLRTFFLMTLTRNLKSVDTDSSGNHHTG